MVAKNDLFWYLSYSRYAKQLMNIIDAFDECRRKCYQILNHNLKQVYEKFLLSSSR